MALSRNERTTNSAERNRSRYTQGGTVDRYTNRLGWWERRPLVKDSTDIRLVVAPNEIARPDLISYRAYGRSDLTWLVLQYNNIVDVNEEIIVGKELVLPAFERLALDILTQPVGGKRV